VRYGDQVAMKPHAPGGPPLITIRRANGFHEDRETATMVEAKASPSCELINFPSGLIWMTFEAVRLLAEFILTF